MGWRSEQCAGYNTRVSLPKYLPPVCRHTHPTLEDSWPFRENKLPKVGSSLSSKPQSWSSDRQQILVQ